MQHALIIGGDRNSLDSLEDELWEIGYHSIVAARDMAEAREVTSSFYPNLIIVVHDASSSRLLDDLYRMSDITGAPVIVARADPAEALRYLGPSASPDRPYPIHAAAEAGRGVPSHPAHLAHAA